MSYRLLRSLVRLLRSLVPLNFYLFYIHLLSSWDGRCIFWLSYTACCFVKCFNSPKSSQRERIRQLVLFLLLKIKKYLLSVIKINENIQFSNIVFLVRRAKSGYRYFQMVVIIIKTKLLFDCSLLKRYICKQCKVWTMASLVWSVHSVSSRFNLRWFSAKGDEILDVWSLVLS